MLKKPKKNFLKKFFFRKISQFFFQNCFFFKKNFFKIFFQFFFRNEISDPENPRNRKIFSIGFDLVEQQAKKIPKKARNFFFF